MVQDEDLIGMPVYKLNGLGQVPLEDQDVVGEIVSPETIDTAIEVVAEHVLVIWFVMQNMAYAFEPEVLGIAIQEAINVILDERNPSNNTANQGAFFGQLKEPLRFKKSLASLHSDGAFNAGLLAHRSKIWREKIAPERLHRSGHPNVIVVIVLPQMVMSVNQQASDSNSCWMQRVIR